MDTNIGNTIGVKPTGKYDSLEPITLTVSRPGGWHFQDYLTADQALDLAAELRRVAAQIEVAHA